MTFLVSSAPIASEPNWEVDDAELPSGQIWACSWEFRSCLDYGKIWTLRSNFLIHLQERETHGTTATTHAARRVIETEWGHTTDPYLPPQAAPDFRSWEDPE